MAATTGTQGDEGNSMAASGNVRRRQRDEDQDGPADEDTLRGGARSRRRMRNDSEETGDDAGVGMGPRWGLPEGQRNNDAGVNYEAERRIDILLQQALSCSELADVRFEFGDGTSLLAGHLGILCGVNNVLEKMFLSGMQEARTRVIRIFGISQESFRAFLEFLYLGRPGKKMAGADGREMWLLAERYECEGIKEWLMGEGLIPNQLCAVVQYAMEGDGEGRDQLLEACRAKSATICPSIFDEACLRGVSAFALREVLESHRRAAPGVLEGERATERFRAGQG